MALVVCKECGKNISDKAARCPNCGSNRRFAIGLTSGQKTRGHLAGVYAIILAIIFCLFPFCVGYPKDFPECFLISFILLIIGITFIFSTVKTPTR